MIVVAIRKPVCYHDGLYWLPIVTDRPLFSIFLDQHDHPFRLSGILPGQEFRVLHDGGSIGDSIIEPLERQSIDWTKNGF